MAGPSGRAVFWKEKDKVARLLARWSPQALATALGRMAEAGRMVMRSAGRAASPWNRRSWRSPAPRTGCADPIQVYGDQIGSPLKR